MLHTDLNGKKVIISGSGNVGSYAAFKAREKGAVIIAMSDSAGFVYNPKGINPEFIKEVKEIRKVDISNYLSYDKEATFTPNPKEMWKIPCDVAFPCATQNELDKESCEYLVKNKVLLVAEGANMPTTKDGIDLLLKNNILFAPGKAANAGGVTVSGLEISQNHQFIQYRASEVDEILCEIMRKIFNDVYQTAKLYNRPNDLLFGANIYSFLKVAQATYEQGIT
jgi:glutamate dehydrogenase (NADP+)